MGKRSRRQFVLTGTGPTLGTMTQVRTTLGDFNTAADGGPSKSMGTEFLYGPGFTLEMAANDPVTQAIISVSDDDLALPVLMRLCRAKAWKLTDLESGRTFAG